MLVFGRNVLSRSVALRVPAPASILPPSRRLLSAPAAVPLSLHRSPLRCSNSLTLSVVLNRFFSTQTAPPPPPPPQESEPVLKRAAAARAQPTVQVRERDPFDAPAATTTEVVPSDAAAPATTDTATAAASGDLGVAAVPAEGDSHFHAAEVWSRVERLLSSEVVLQRREGRDLFELMIKPHATDAQWRVVFEHLASISHVDTIFRLVEELAAGTAGNAVLSLPTFNVLMTAFGAAGNQRRALWLAEYMKHCRVMCDETTIVGLMRAFAWHVEAPAVTKWFEYLLELGIKPTRLSYNVLLKTLTRAGDTDTALTFYSHMKSANVEPDAYTFNTLFLLAKQSGRHRLVGDLYRDMTRAGVAMDVHMATSLVSLYSRRGDLDAVTRWYDRAVREHRVQPNRVLFGAVLQAFARAKNPDGFMHYYRRMRTANWRPDLTTYKQMILPWLWGAEPPVSDVLAHRVLRAARACEARLPSVGGTRTADRENAKWHLGNTELTFGQKSALKSFVEAVSEWVDVRRDEAAKHAEQTRVDLLTQQRVQLEADEAEKARREKQRQSAIDARRSPLDSAEREFEQKELAAELAAHESNVQNALYPDPVAAAIVGDQSNDADPNPQPRGRRSRSRVQK